jgi:hypothetical protein
MNIPARSPTFTPSADTELDDIYRMPSMLGRASGPRNMPKSKAHLSYAGEVTTLGIRALTDEKALSALLPPRCRLAGAPTLNVTYAMLSNLGWLAGRGYNILKAQSEIVFEGDDGDVRGNLSWVLWENHADPIVTGRDELGTPKLYATLPDIRMVGNSASAAADWEGHRFFEIEAHDLVPDTQTTTFDSYAAQGGLPLLCYRYHARVGDWEAADIANMTMSTPGLAPAPVLREQLKGSGEFRFLPARWEDMPTQYTYANTLAALPLIEFQPARISKVSGMADLAAMVTIR